jgi:hypothetical protein
MDPAMMRRITAVKKPQNHTTGAFGKCGCREVEYQYRDVYQKKSKRTGAMLTGKTLIGY